MPDVRRLAIVNRGEPAMRCLAAVGELGEDFGEPVTTIALYTDPDAVSLFVRQADEAVPLGPALITEPDGSRHSAYVDIDTVMAALAAPAPTPSGWAGVSSPSRPTSPRGAKRRGSRSSARRAT